MYVGGASAHGSSAAAAAAAMELQQHHHHHHQQQHHQHQHQPVDSNHEHSRKRKTSFCRSSDLDDDQTDDAKSVRTNEESKKQNHSEIEKRRRDKMNTYITELSAMVPMCHAMSRKLDKLTVLRMAVQHLKTIRGAVHSYTEGHYKPSFLSDQELKTLILQAAEGFLFVVGCDRGRILYVSESVSQVLNYSQGDLLGQSWFDILHPKDVAKVKEQLSSSDLSPRERLIDAKTMLPVKADVPAGASRLCPGARRSFFCRMKCRANGPPPVKEEADTTTGCQRRKKQQNLDRKYCVIQCTGYLKSWAPAKIGLEEAAAAMATAAAAGGAGASTSGRRPPNVRAIQFISRHALDGKFLFVDQRATLVLGFLQQELLGTSMYEYYHHEDIPRLAEAHRAALQSAERVTTQVYRFRSKDGSFVRLQSEWKSFRNPWTKDVEYLVAKNSLVLCPDGALRPEGPSQSQATFDFFSQYPSSREEPAGNGVPAATNGGGQQGGARDMQCLIKTHVEASKIGRQIAEAVLDAQRRVSDDSSASPSPPGVAAVAAAAADVFFGAQPLSSLEVASQNALSPQRCSSSELPTIQGPASMEVDQSAHRPMLPVGDVDVHLHYSDTFNPNGRSNEQKSQISTNILGNDRQLPQRHMMLRPNHNNNHPSSFNNIRNNVQLSIPNDQGIDTDDMMEMIGGAMLPDSPHPSASNDGNDEAAMAVIMSLLEADAGLGGPVDFSGLPWPLP